MKMLKMRMLLLCRIAAAARLEVHNAQLEPPFYCPILCPDKESCNGSRYQNAVLCQKCPICNGAKIEEPAVAQGPRRKKEDVGKVKRTMAELEGLIGMEEVKAQMQQIVAQVRFNLQREKLKLPDIGGQSLHMAFMGNPGTGKTVVARIVGDLLVSLGAIKSSGENTVVVEASRGDLVGEYVGWTAKKVKEAFEKAQGGVLFIDEAYSLVRDEKDSFGLEAVDTIIKLMEDERDSMVVILAGYQKEMADFISANPGFKSRIAFNFNFPDYTCSELLDIGQSMLQQKNVALPLNQSCASEKASLPEHLQEACDWLADAISFQTGCCKDDDCKKEENRANGNGRSVRNILEASYRYMAGRALTTFPPKLLSDYAESVHPQVEGSGKNSVPVPPLSCPSVLTGHFTSLEELKDIDPRCAFWMAAPSDFKQSLKQSLEEKLRESCEKSKSPLYVNVSKVFDSGATFDWNALHQRLHKDNDCNGAQALLSPSSSLLEIAVEGCTGCTGGACTERRCSACPSCLGFDHGGGDEASEAKCELCDWVKKRFHNQEVPQGQDKELCADYTGVSGSWCRYVVRRSLRELNDKGNFSCAAILELNCPDLQGVGGPRAAELDLFREGSRVTKLIEELSELVGLRSVKKGIGALRDAVEFDVWRRHFLGEYWTLLGQSYHMRFLGNPGTGKTVVARIVGQILTELGVVSGGNGFIFKEASRADLVATHSGQTAPKVKKVVESAFGGVLFIDEAYSLIQDEKDSFGYEAVDTLIKEMEDHKDKVIVILAGYSKEMEEFFKSNPGFQSRVPFTFDFADYSCEELSDIANLTLSKQDMTASKRATQWLSAVVKEKTGCCSQAQMEGGPCASLRDNGNGRAVRNLVEASIRAMSRRAVFAVQQGQEESLALVTTLEDADVVTVAGDLLKEEIRKTKKNLALRKDKEDLKDFKKVNLETVNLDASFTVEDFEKAVSMAKTDYAAATKMFVEKSIPVAQIEVKKEELQPIFAELDELVGLSSVKGAMREFYATVEFASMRKRKKLQALQSQSFHMRFLGNPGTGKTVVARIVGKLLVKMGAIKGAKGKKDVFNEVSRADLIGQYLGQTAPKVMKQVEESLGGVLFLDEAYAVKRDGKDPFGQEAVDTLIKEMEDKRENLIVILAGYEEEMERFFMSNPGFKSRVPFTFHFEDYVCHELYDIGKLALKKQELKLPSDLEMYHSAVAFSTGCCETLEMCQPDRAKGNGRAVRNTLEAAVRAMAARVQGGNASVDMYTQLHSEDFAVVTSQAVQQGLATRCSKSGDLGIIQKYVRNQENASLRGDEAPGSDLPHKLTSIISESAAITKIRGLDDRAVNTAKKCQEKVKAIESELAKSLSGSCAAVLPLAEHIQQENERSKVEGMRMYMKGVLKNIDTMKELSLCFGDSAQPHGVVGLFSTVIDACDMAEAKIRSMSFRMPFSIDW